MELSDDTMWRVLADVTHTYRLLSLFENTCTECTFLVSTVEGGDSLYLFHSNALKVYLLCRKAAFLLKYGVELCLSLVMNYEIKEKGNKFFPKGFWRNNTFQVKSPMFYEKSSDVLWNIYPPMLMWSWISDILWNILRCLCEVESPLF